MRALAKKQHFNVNGIVNLGGITHMRALTKTQHFNVNGITHMRAFLF